MKVTEQPANNWRTVLMMTTNNIAPLAVAVITEPTTTNH